MADHRLGFFCNYDLQLLWKAHKNNVFLQIRSFDLWSKANNVFCCVIWSSIWYKDAVDTSQFNNLNRRMLLYSSNTINIMPKFGKHKNKMANSRTALIIDLMIPT